MGGNGDELRARIRASCCPFHGLSPAQFERHIEGVARVVEESRERRRRSRARRPSRAA
jgi:hypothetical protein